MALIFNSHLKENYLIFFAIKGMCTADKENISIMLTDFTEKGPY